MPLISVDGADVTLGFSIGRMRSTKRLERFEIMKHPVSRATYRECVRASECAACPAEVDAETPGSESDALPVTCAQPKDAARFCAWVGGRLPTLAEWMLASRGPSPQRYAWGDARPSCAAGEAGSTAEAECAGLAASSIGAYPGGASPSGVEDVLLTRGELLAADAVSPYPACRSKAGHCVVFGLVQRAIDSVAPIGAEGKTIGLDVTYGFRCLVPGEK